MADYKLLPGGKLPRDPSPRPVTTTHSERQRDGEREENRRRESNTEIIRDKTRYRETESMEKHYERDRAPPPRTREGEREWRERERRQDDRSRNGRLLSNLEEREQYVERGKRKGDTFPRMRKVDDRNTTFTTDRRDKRERERPQRAETEKWENERERTWQREGERGEIKSRYKDGQKNTGRRQGGDEQLHQKERFRQCDVYQNRREMVDSRHGGEREADRKREKIKLNMNNREARAPSPRRREREVNTERREREKAHKREGRRDTRSEGDSGERELRRERVRDREREELIYQQSKSEGDIEGKSARERDRDRQVEREQDRQRNRDREDNISRRKGEKDRYREDNRQAERPASRDGDRWGERDVREGRALPNDRREDYRYRDGRERDANHRRDDMMGQSNRAAKESSRVAPRAQGSDEWSSKVDSDMRYYRDRDRYEMEGRKVTGERRREEHRDLQKGAERDERQQVRREKQPRDEAEMAWNDREQRRMWLDPQRGKNSREELVDKERQRERKDRGPEKERSVSQAEREKVKEEPDDVHLAQSHCKERQTGTDKRRGDTVRETEEVSVDQDKEGEIPRESDKRAKEQLSDSDGGKKGSWQKDAENVTDKTEESDREEEGGSDCWARSESEGGSDTGWKQAPERMLSGEDGFVTVSSGGDEDCERESDENEFKDCQEFWDGRHHSPVGSKGCEGDEQRTERSTGKEQNVDEGAEENEKQQKYVFCVISQSLPRAGAVTNNPASEDYRGQSDVRHQSDDDVHLTLSGNEQPVTNDEDMEREHHAQKEEAQADDVKSKGRGTLNRDSQTERLLKEWREKNTELGEIKTSADSYSDVFSQVNFEQIQPLLEQINNGAMSPEEVEAIRIRMSGAWSMSEEPKRHSQAPHLKWAKNVVREILGHSDEHVVDETNTEAREDQGVNQSETENKQQHEVARGTEELPLFKVTAGGEHSEPELEDDELMEVEGLRGTGQSQDVMHGDQHTAMHVVTSAHTHSDTLLNTARKEDHGTDEQTARLGEAQLEEEEREVRMGEDGPDELTLTENEESRDEEIKMFLSVSKTLYKPSSCPILNYQSESDLLSPSREEVEGGLDDSEEEQQGEALENRDAEHEAGAMTAGETEVDRSEEVAAESEKGTVTSSSSFRDLGPEVRLRRRGIRKTTERRDGELEQVEEEEGVGRDRRTRIFPVTDDDDEGSKSWGEVELRNVLETINRQKRNSRFFNAAQLYQQYSEEAQNFEILRQSRSHVLSVCEDTAASPAPSPPPARRPLPPLPPVPHPHSFSHTGSITSVQSLPLPEPPRGGGRPASPRLSISLSQSASLWRDLPAVRNSTELEDLTEDQTRLQEVRFEVVTSEASYCRSLDIVVDYFVKSKPLQALLTNQDRSWLFSRLADVRAISHSFLSKLEERVESNMMHFTVCDIIARHCQRFKMVYVPYLTNQSYQDDTYQRLMNDNPRFKQIVEKMERSPVCQRLPLRSFLVLPFQRITRIKLLVQNIVKRTTPGTPEAMYAIKALKLLEKLIQESNDSITQMKSIESLISLSAKVDFTCKTLPLASQSRRLVREGPVTELMDFSIKDTEKNIYMHLFNDYLLLSLQKEGGRFTVFDHAPVSDLRVENCRVKLHSLQKNLFRLYLSQKSLLLRTDTQSDKLRWISAISRPHPETDFCAAQDFEQMQCIRAFVAQQPDELSLEKADVILVHQQSSDNWVEGTRLSDRHRGWVPKSHLKSISSSTSRQNNLSDALKLTTATAAV